MREDCWLFSLFISFERRTFIEHSDHWHVFIIHSEHSDDDRMWRDSKDLFDEISLEKKSFDDDNRWIIDDDRIVSNLVSIPSGISLGWWEIPVKTNWFDAFRWCLDLVGQQLDQNEPTLFFNRLTHRLVNEYQSTDGMINAFCFSRIDRRASLAFHYDHHLLCPFSALQSPNVLPLSAEWTISSQSASEGGSIIIRYWYWPREIPNVLPCSNDIAECLGSITTFDKKSESLPNPFFCLFDLFPGSHSHLVHLSYFIYLTISTHHLVFN